MKGRATYKIMTILLFYGLMACKDRPKLFTSLPTDHTRIEFENTVTETDELNINNYLYAHNGGGVGIGDFNNDGLPDIYFTANQTSNRLFLNKGNFVFEDITESAGVAGLVGPNNWTTGVTVVDIDQDGWLDIYVNLVSDGKTFEGQNQLFVNNGDNTFTDKAAQYGLALEGYSQQAVFFDYDLDGDLDMYQLNHSVHELDVYVKAENRSKRDNLAGDRLFRNEGNKFTDVSEIAGIYGGATGYGLSVVVSDLDDNGCPDIYVSNDFHDNDYLYFNQCDGTFHEDVANTMGHTSTFSMGSDIADMNNDGSLDIMTLDMKPEDEIIRKSSAGADPYDIYKYKKSFGFQDQYPRNMLQLNQGNLFGKNAQFSEVGQMAGIEATDWSWSVLLCDFDNDGLNDIHITNGILRRPNDLDYINYTYNTEAVKNRSTLELAQKMPDGRAKNYAYRNTGNLGFENVSASWGLDFLGCSMGTAYADFDNDGDLDLAINNLNHAASIYRNNSEKITKNNYLKVSLQGNKKNKGGLGAKVEVYLKNKILTQELNPVRGWLSSSEPVLNFGLGKCDKVAKVKIRWYDGKSQVIENCTPNQNLILKYENAVLANNFESEPQPLFSEVHDAGIDFIHKENKFSDFNTEQLIPHKLSTEGPKIAVADVNNDGMEDFFICGAAGQSSELFLQQQAKGKPRFIKSDNSTFELDKEAEAVNAAFFDADGDGDKDLYVVNGGGQAYGQVIYGDQLYLNDGNGIFVKSGKFPKIEANGSCVIAADFNGDGAKDIFLGSRSVPGSYGLSPDSYLLWNDGAGNFKVDTTDYSNVLKNLGMITDAIWNDNNGQLVVVGEWMPITFLNFTEKKLEKWELPESYGWWNTIEQADLDNDGDMDFLVGNLGENSCLKASRQAPVKLLVKDWDANGSIDPLLVYQKQGKEWLFNGLAELKKQMPRISIRYPNYTSFAKHTLNEVFSDSDLRSVQIKTSMIFKSVQVVNKGAGNYQMKSLPGEIQRSPIYAFLADDFNSDGNIDILSAGNFFAFTTALGRFDASYGNLLVGNQNGDFSAIRPEENGFNIRGEVRDIQPIKVGDEKWLLIARNNEPMVVFSQKNSLGKKLL